jgi:hypothetical protein
VSKHYEWRKGDVEVKLRIEVEANLTMEVHQFHILAALLWEREPLEPTGVHVGHTANLDMVVKRKIPASDGNWTQAI